MFDNNFAICHRRVLGLVSLHADFKLQIYIKFRVLYEVE